MSMSQELEMLPVPRPAEDEKKHDVVVIPAAVQAETSERELGVLEAIRLYPMSIFWSFAMSMTIVMEAYDKGLIGSLYAQKAFTARFGDYYPAKELYSVPASWQAALSQASNVGIFIGIVLNGFVVDRFGYKRVTMGALCFMTAFIFLVVFAPNRGALFAGQLLCGLPWGTFIACSPAYASEVSPQPLRGIMTTYINLCFCAGQFIAAGVLLGVNTRTDQWGYRIPFHVQLAWPLPLFILIAMAPESPWWYVRKGRIEEAKRSVTRLRGTKGPISASDMVSMMVKTNEEELALGLGVNVSYGDCFRGVDLRRTEIVCLAWATQLMSGQNFTAYMTYFFTLSGLKSSDSFKLNLGNTALGFIGTVLSWFLLVRFGRPQIFLTGLTIMTTIMFLVGALYWSAENGPGARWAQAALLMTWTCVSDMSIGPVVYAIVSETSSTRLRAKSVGIARNAYVICALAFGFAVPFMMNATYGNLKGQTAFLFFGTSVVALVWAFFRLPECKGRSYRELDLLFVRRVPARRFAHTKVDDLDQ